MSVNAYQKAALTAESPREAEYRLFAQVTAQLIEAQSADRKDFQKRIGALDLNRRLWTALATDCANPDNKLPPETRASIISLSLFVGRHSSEIMAGSEDFEALIDINRTIMQGLDPRAVSPGGPGL
jgi:flagellar biosynthesis activator protein FlaF